MKVGKWGKDATQSEYTFPTMIGRDTSPNIQIGDEAFQSKDRLNITSPIKHDIIEDWDDMIKMWEYVFTKKLQIPMDQLDQYEVIFSEVSNNPIQKREEMCRLMFEHFKLRGFYVAVQGVLSLYANGKTTGIVCDLGDTVSHAVPVFESFAVRAVVQSSNIGGATVTDNLGKLWKQEMKGTAAVPGNFRDAMQEVKE